MTNQEENLCRTVAVQTKSAVRSCTHAGSGASGSVYCVSLADGTRMAVKYSEHEPLARREWMDSRFLYDCSPLPVPEPYFFCSVAGERPAWLFAMQYVDGISAENLRLRFRRREKRQNYTDSILDALEQLQQIKSDHYGEVGGILTDSWEAFYRPFAQEQLAFARETCSQDRLAPAVLDSMEYAFACYEQIFPEPAAAVLTHGDFWTPNMLLDPESLQLKAVLDPYRVKWAAPAYELFALKVGVGARFGLYERYKARMMLDEITDLQTEFYALFSEVSWYAKLGSVSHPFLKAKAKSLRRELARFGLR